MENKEFLSEYRTGDVQPPRSYRGLITILLLLVIFLGGLVSALGFWGIHLFRLLQNTEDTTVLLIEDMPLSMADEPAGYIQIDCLGIEGSFLSAFDQAYFDFPQGIYITYSATPDIYIGDVLLRINGETITGQEELNTLLQSHSAGAAVTLEIYREGKQHTLAAILENPEE